MFNFACQASNTPITLDYPPDIGTSVQKDKSLATAKCTIGEHVVLRGEGRLLAGNLYKAHVLDIGTVKHPGTVKVLFMVAVTNLK